MTDWGKIVSDKVLAAIKTTRGRTYITSKQRTACLNELLDEGWSIDREYINSKYISMKKDKPFDEVFEDRVWTLFANLGFTLLNKDRYFKMNYDFQNPNITKQIDVFAVDDETVILVECKAARDIKDANFKTDIESYGGMMDGLRKEALQRYPGRKVKFIWATSNYRMTKVDIERLESFKIVHFTEEIICYYAELSKHLGTSARYQLHGNLFADQKIKSMDTRIPAIEGKMGGHTYYSFSIEPEKLLKIGYVLHRNEANRNMMPTYQRLIKKKRLVEVKNFIKNGGYFPNSLIISIDTTGKGVQFDRAATQVDGAISKIGILHLPQKYRSAYIIDGQHRLYGYSDSEYAIKNSIPVVAFVDLERENQVKLFMEINENQKAVSKNLRNTLNSDMLWASNDWNERRQALRLNIAQCLGEELTSPLYGRIIIGENEKTSDRCITIDSIQTALKNCNFFSTFGKQNAILKDGTMDKGTNELTKKTFYPFIESCLEYIKENLKDEWKKGEDNLGILTINTGINSIIRIINDVLDHLILTQGINPKIESIEELVDKMKYYLDPVIDFYNNISSEDRVSIKKTYGGAAPTKYWRTLQKSIHGVRLEFNPDGMEEWWLNNTKVFNDESFKFIREIEFHLKKMFAKGLEDKHGPNWLVVGVPKSVYTRAKSEADDQNYERLANGDDGDEISLWSCVNTAECKEIAAYGRNWSEIFEDVLVRPEDEKILGGRAAKTEWMTRLNTIRNKATKSSYSVSKDEYEFLKEIHIWIINKKYK